MSSSVCENLIIIIIIIRNTVHCVVGIKYVTPTPYNGSHYYNIFKIHRRNNTV